MSGFAVGDVVRAADAPHAGHHRVPRYARGRRGTVVKVHPSFPVPDDIVAGIPHAPETVYSVRFEATTIWGESAEPFAAVVLDIWQRFLTPVSEESEVSA
jgi:hypothetical protein